MATRLGSLSVFLTSNVTDFKRGMFSARRAISGLSTFTQFAAIGIGAAMAKIGYDSTQAAIAAEETRNKFDVVYRDIRDEARFTARVIADSFDVGIDKSTEMLAATGDLLTGFGFSQREALKMSKRIAELGGDLASFQDIAGGVAEATQRITSGVLGRTRNLQTLGVVVRQDTAEFKKLVRQQMEATGQTMLQAKATVILNMAIAQSKNAIGDYARTAGSAANQQRKLAAQWEQAKINIGEVTLSVVDLAGALVGLNDAMGFLADKSFVTFGRTVATEIEFAIRKSGALIGWLFDNIKVGWQGVKIAVLGVWEAVGEAVKLLIKDLENRIFAVIASFKIAANTATMFVSMDPQKRKRAADENRRLLAQQKELAKAVDLGQFAQKMQGIFRRTEKTLAGAPGLIGFGSLEKDIRRLEAEKNKKLEGIFNDGMREAAKPFKKAGEEIEQDSADMAAKVDKLAPAVMAGSAEAFKLMAQGVLGPGPDDAKKMAKKNTQANVRQAGILDRWDSSGVPLDAGRIESFGIA